MQQVEIGIIGGSGLYHMPGLTETSELPLSTPFGDPSAPLIAGQLEGRQVAFLARHGMGHHILPHELNFRANIYAFKALGVERILSISAVGSLKAEHSPGEFVIPDQFVDFTKSRISTFFGEGLVAHVALADPVCPDVVRSLSSGCTAAAVAHKDRGTYICIEGPQFSTRAESELYRSWGMDVIGMTAAQEAKLAREAEVCYASLAMVTDYDCWHPTHDSVTVDQIIAVLNRNAQNACRVVRHAVAVLPKERSCKCGGALKHAIMTSTEAIPKKTRAKLNVLLDKHLAAH